MQIELIDKGINEAGRIVIGDILVERWGKEHDRVARGTLDVWHATLILVNIM